MYCNNLLLNSAQRNLIERNSFKLHIKKADWFIQLLLGGRL